MAVSERATMVIQSYQDRAEQLVNEYALSDSAMPYVSIIGGIFACKLVYDLAHLISSVQFKSYSSPSKSQRVEWRNRAVSTVHAVVITVLALYFVFWSDLFRDELHDGNVMLQRSPFSTFVLGVSLGYFITDLGMIIWFYPDLGGLEYVVHHLFSLVSLSYTMLSGEVQVYSYMVLISEITTPGINLRWYLDTAGLKRSRAYIINGVVIFLTWLVARLILFLYIYVHVYVHYHQVIELHTFGMILVLVVPVMLGVMNVMWFAKIFRGLKKTLAKRQ